MPQTPTRRRWLPILLGAALLGVSGCAAPGAGGGRDPGAVRIDFQVVEEPGAFDVEGPARRPATDAPGGYWAVVPGLPRAESAVIRRPGQKPAVTVALFRAPQGRDNGILLSEAAAAALGIGDAPVVVRVTAVRQEPELVLPANRF